MGFGRPVLDANPGGRILTWHQVDGYIRSNSVPDTAMLHTDDDGRVIIGVEVDAERIILTSSVNNLGRETPMTLAGLRDALATAGAQGDLRLTIWFNNEVYRIVDLGYFYNDDDHPDLITDFMLQRRWG